MSCQRSLLWYDDDDDNNDGINDGGEDDVWCWLYDCMIWLWSEVKVWYAPPDPTTKHQTPQTPQTPNTTNTKHQTPQQRKTKTQTPNISKLDWTGWLDWTLGTMQITTHHTTPNHTIKHSPVPHPRNSEELSGNRSMWKIWRQQWIQLGKVITITY